MEIYTRVRMVASVGLRNILIHEYFGVDNQIVWDIVKNKLLPLKTACQKVMEAD